MMGDTDLYFRSMRAANLASSRAGLEQSRDLTELLDLDQSARELADMIYLESSEDKDLNDEVENMNGAILQ